MYWNLHPDTDHASSGTTGSCMKFYQNSLSDSRRRLCTHPDFSDAINNLTRMVLYFGESQIKEMVQENTALRIFIADDSRQIRERIALKLGACAMTIVGHAATPQDSINGILTVYPDVVVLDVQLEGGSGLQVLRAIRHAAPNIAFVIFSNSSDVGYRKRYMGAGAENFLDKTHEFDQLAQAVVNASQHSEH